MKSTFSRLLILKVSNKKIQEKKLLEKAYYKSLILAQDERSRYA